MKIVEAYLNSIDKNTRIEGKHVTEMLREGWFGDLFSKICEFLSGGFPRDPEFKSIWGGFHHAEDACYRSFPPKRSQTTKSGQAGRSYDDETAWTSQAEETVEDNPKLAVCLARAELEFLRDVVQYLKKKGRQVCRNNINEERCEKWLARNLPQYERQLKAMENAVKSASNDPSKMAKVIKK